MKRKGLRLNKVDTQVVRKAKKEMEMQRYLLLLS